MEATALKPNKHHGRAILLLTSLMAVTSVIVFWDYLTKQDLFIFSDIGNDTKNVYYAFFMSLARKLETGDFSMWDFYYGLGETILARQSDVVSLSAWLVALAGQENGPYVLVLTHILKVFVSGYICYFYLDTFEFSPFTKVITAYAFAFNGFTMLWGQHYFFANCAGFVALLLFTIEKTFKNPRWLLGFAAAAALLMANSYYKAYMSLLFAGIYTLIRLAYLYPLKEIKRSAAAVGNLLVGFCIGAAMSAVLFLPSAYALLSTSERVGGGGSALSHLFGFGFYGVRDMIMTLSRLFSNNLMGTTEFVGQINYYEDPELFLTSFILFFLILFCLQTLFGREPLRKKIVKLGSVALVGCMFVHTVFSVVLNAFTYPAYRYTYILMPVFALLMAYELDKMLAGQLRYAGLQIAAAVVGSITALALTVYVVNYHGLAAARWLPLEIMILTVCLGFLALFLQEKWPCRWMKGVFSLGIAAIIVLNVSMENLVTNNHRDSVLYQFPTFHEDWGNAYSLQALDYIARLDDSMYRTDKTYVDSTQYNDAMTQGYYSATVYNSAIDSSLLQFARTMCPEYNANGNFAYSSFGEIYENIPLANMLGVKYLLSRDVLDAPYREINRFGDIIVYENTAFKGFGMLYGDAVDSDAYMARPSTRYEQDELILEGVGQQAKIGSGQGTVTLERPHSGVMNGVVNSETDNYLFVSIPVREGWKAYVDGVETEIIPANIAFTAIRVAAGEHTVRFVYETPLLKEGAVISIVGLAAFAAVYWMQKKRYAA